MSKPERRKATDHDIVMRVVNIIGAIAAGLVLAIIVGTWTGRAVDAAIAGLAGTAIGYLGGILTNAFRSPVSTAQPVTVENDPKNPVPVETASGADGTPDDTPKGDAG
jgi:hypothetical protein